MLSVSKISGKGSVSHDEAMEKEEKEYEVFRVKQDKEYISEFDRGWRNILAEKNKLD